MYIYIWTKQYRDIHYGLVHIPQLGTFGSYRYSYVEHGIFPSFRIRLATEVLLALSLESLQTHYLGCRVAYVFTFWFLGSDYITMKPSNTNKCAYEHTCSRVTQQPGYIPSQNMGPYLNLYPKKEEAGKGPKWHSLRTYGLAMYHMIS